VVDADSGLYNQDFRALEHLGQLLTQVAGRAGRATHEGQVIIQTHMPNHPLLNLLIQQGYDAFAHELLHARQAAQLPPYHYLAIIRAQAKEKSHACDFLTAIKLYTAGDNVRVLGPAPAPLARKANQYHLQLLLKSSSRAHLQATLKAIREWLLINKKGKKVRWSIDVDPLTLA